MIELRPRCERCCYWSDQLAEIAHGRLRAICLNMSAQTYGSFMEEDSACDRFLAGEPIDAYARKAKYGA